MMRKYLLQLVFWVFPTKDIGNEYESAFIMDAFIYKNIHIANVEAHLEPAFSAIKWSLIRVSLSCECPKINQSINISLSSNLFLALGNSAG